MGKKKHLSDLVAKILNVVLNHKYVSIKGRIMMKKRSLSIGEKIATAAANLHRDISFENIIDRAILAGKITHYSAYVDDTLSFVSGSDHSIHNLMRELNDFDPEQFNWEFQFHRTTANFLDLTFNIANGVIHTTTYRKPGYRPQFLHIDSDHATSMKRSLCTSQFARFLFNNSTASSYDEDCKQFLGGLKVRGYPSHLVKVPQYSAQHREQLLDALQNKRIDKKLKAQNVNRGSLNRNAESAERDLVTMVLPFNSALARLGLVRKAKQLFQQIHLNARPIVGFSMSTNLFMRTYRQNTPFLCLSGVPG